MANGNGLADLDLIGNDVASKHINRIKDVTKANFSRLRSMCRCVHTHTSCQGGGHVD